MNLKAIRLFLHIMQRGSLVAAASELNMSPSAASRLLTGLERTTGLVLFSRDRHRLHPTAEGEQYFNECHRVLVAVDELPRTAKRLASGTGARLRVFSMPRFATSLMVPAIERFLKGNPDIEIDLEVVLRYEVEPARSERPFDIGVVTLPLRHAAAQSAPLFDMPATAIMRRDHPLAKRAFVRASDLAAERLVAVEPRMGIRDVMEEMFSAEGLELRPQLTATNIDIACQLVNRTNAITVAEPLVPLTLDSEAFAFVPMKPLHTVHVGIVTPPLKPDSRLTTLFKASLREEAKAIEQRLARRLVNPNGREARRPGGAKLKTRRKSQPRYE